MIDSIPGEVLESFALDADASVEQLAAGHLHDTFLLASPEPVIVQRVNERVFRAPHELTRNLLLVETALSRAQLPTLHWLRDQQGSALVRDRANAAWRAYPFIPGEVDTTVNSLEDVERVSRAFGEFAGALASEALSDFTEVIASFHDFPARERAWRFAVLRDEAHRFLRAQPEIERAARLVDRVHELDEFEAWLQMPRQLGHNDAKPANVVRADDGTCTIIDLDTTMASPRLCDVGELVRTLTRSSAEDDDRAASALQTERVGLVLRGWLDGYARPLDATSQAALPIAGAVLTLENALRFLTDYLDGDVYFAVNHSEHNLVRARAQIGHAQALLDGINDLRRVAAHELRRAK